MYYGVAVRAYRPQVLNRIHFKVGLLQRYRIYVVHVDKFCCDIALDFVQVVLTH